MEIREAAPQDAEAIADLLDQVLMVHHNGRPDLFKADTRKYSDDEILALIADPERPLFVACDEASKVLGYAICMIERYEGHATMTDRTTLYVDDICVDEGARGKGVGRAVYEHTLAFARSIGCHNLTLNVWSCNPGAQAFYEAMGMRPYRIGMEQLL